MKKSDKSPEAKRLAMRDKVRAYFAKRAKALGAIDWDVYTRDEWRERGEDIGNEYEVTMTAEGALNHALNYDPKEVERLQKWMKANDMWWEQGFSWSWHFYPWEPPPKRKSKKNRRNPESIMRRFMKL